MDKSVVYGAGGFIAGYIIATFMPYVAGLPAFWYTPLIYGSGGQVVLSLAGAVIGYFVAEQ